MQLRRLCLFFLLAACSIFASAQSESYDEPVHKTVINLGKSPYLMPNSPSRIQLFCFYYKDFLIKELDNPGLKGTRWVTITPVINNENQLPCRVKYAPAERFLAKKWWSFLGVKGSLLFLEAADGDNNQGMPFRVLDLKTGKKIFEDSAWWNGHLEFVRNIDETVSLRYLRVVGGDCSIAKDGIRCWNQFKKHYGLTTTTLPVCTGYKHEGDKEWVVGDPGMPPEEIAVPSTIAYPVAVDLFPKPSIKAIPGPLKCSAI